MNKILNFFLLLLLSLTSNNVFAQINNADNPSVFVVANINNRIITNVDLKNRYDLTIEFSKINLSSIQEKEVVLNQLLQKMIDQELQIMEAKKLKINFNQKKLDNFLVEFSKDYGVVPENLRNIFFQKSLSYDNFLKQVKSQIVWSQIISQVISPRIKVSQSEIDELLELQNIRTSAEKLFLAEIYIPTNHNDFDSKVLISKLSYELKKNGKSFSNIVSQFSHSPTAEFRGEIGWVAFGDVDDRIFNAVSTLKVGGVSDSVLLDDGYYLFKVLDKKIFDTLSQEDIKRVRANIFNKKLNLAAKKYMMDLKKGSYVEVI